MLLSKEQIRASKQYFSTAEKRIEKNLSKTPSPFSHCLYCTNFSVVMEIFTFSLPSA